MKPYTVVAMVLLAFIGVLQLVRAMEGWDIAVNTFHIPVWPSYIAALVCLGLAAGLWRENRKR